MKIVIYVSILVLFLVLKINFSYAENDHSFLAGVRGSQNELIETIFLSNGKYVLLDSSTNEFDNGNTFVKINSSVGGHGVSVLLPRVFTPNTLMEFLIKISTAKNDGALKVSVLVPEDLKSQNLSLDKLARKIHFNKFSADSAQNLPLVFWTMIKEAGAISVVDINNNKIHELRDNFDLNFPELKTRKFYKETATIIDARDYLDFGKNLSDNLDLSFEDMIISKEMADLYRSNTELKQKQVLYVVPAGENTNKHFFEFVTNAYLYSKNRVQVIGVMPYFHYARTDKKDQRGVAITGSLIVAILERLGVDALVTSRLHAPQTQGFFRSIPSIHVSSRDTITTRLASEGVELVVSPDNGAVKESTLFADDLGVGVETINKQRDPITGVTSIRGISNKDAVFGKIVAVIDDETASGGTGKEVAEYLKSIGARSVIFVVTHLAGKAEKAVNSPYIDKFIVTNTLPIDESLIQAKKIEVLDIVPELASEIKIFLGRPLGHLTTKEMLSRCSMVFLLATI